MVMETVQIRLPSASLNEIDSLVERGIYPNRSEAVRDAVRRLSWGRQVGAIKIKGKGSGVSIVRKARRELSKQKIDLDEINSL